MSDFSDRLRDAMRETREGIAQGAGDVARSMVGGFSDAYQTAFIQGRHVPPSQMTADMVTEHSPAEEIGQSYSAALLEHGAAESRAVQVGRRLLHGWKHHDGIETIQGLKATAAIVEDLLARGPQQAAAQGAPDAQTAKPDDSAAHPVPPTDIAAAYRAALKRTPQRDRPASSLPEPESPDQNRPSRDAPDID